MGTSRPGAKRDERPLVIVEKVRGALRISALDPGAARLGLTRGLALADAHARIPDLRVVEADPAADAESLQRLAGLCERATPLVAIDAPDGLILDVTGCAHLFGGENALRQDLCARLARMGLIVHATLAGTPDAARALVRFSSIAVVAPGKDEAAARRLPVAALDQPTETIVALRRAGLKTLGCLADRASSALVARFGEGLLTKLRRTLGQETAPLTPLFPVPDLIVEKQFPEPLTQADAIENVLAGLIEDAAKALEQRGSGGRAFEAILFRADGAVRRLRVETGRPSRDVKAVLRLFHERLDTLADPIDPGFGFDCIRLAVPVLEPMSQIQTSLDGSQTDDSAVADLMDRLVARFGRDRVLRCEAGDSHHPDREASCVPACDGKTSVTAWRTPEPGEPPRRPIQVFHPPQPIETMAVVPDGPPLRFRWRRVLHEIARAEGPERIAPEWWIGGAETRDYYRIEDADGRRFWVFRQGDYGEMDRRPRWFLHGVFA